MFDNLADTFWWITPKALIGCILAAIGVACLATFFFGYPMIAEAIAFSGVIVGVCAHFIAKNRSLENELLRMQTKLHLAESDVRRSNELIHLLRTRCVELEKILEKYRAAQPTRPSFDTATEFKDDVGATGNPNQDRDGFWDAVGGIFGHILHGLRMGRGGRAEEFVFVDPNFNPFDMFGDQRRGGGFNFGGGTFGQGASGPTNGGRAGETRLYDVLEVKPTDSPETIKAAHRKLAMKWHPDRHMNDPDPTVAEARFKEIQGAYDIVGDEQKRAAYDRYGEAAFKNI